MHGLDPATLIATWESGLTDGPVDRAVRLLATAVGTTEQEAARWDVGSRDRVLAALLRRTAGRVVWTQAGCGGCDATLDVPVDLAAIGQASPREPGEILAVEVSGATIRFRLPTTEDLRSLVGVDPEPARQRLLDRCLVGVGREGAAPERAALEVAAVVEAAMERACPGGAVRIGVTCPECGTTTPAALDLPVLVWAELETRATALLAEVHALASAYGWTEPAVLALSPQRRAAYLELAGS